jgi:hypothetical protein
VGAVVNAVDSWPPALIQALEHLGGNNIRVEVRYRRYFHKDECVVRGYIAWKPKSYGDMMYLYVKHSWYDSPNAHPVDEVLSIRASRGVRRNGKLYYHTYYESNPYQVTDEGALDMSATLRTLLAAS